MEKLNWKLKKGVLYTPANTSLDHQDAIATLAVLSFKPDELPSNESTYLNQAKMILFVAKSKWYTLQPTQLLMQWF